MDIQRDIAKGIDADFAHLERFADVFQAKEMAVAASS
jgi:hypothetical protein